MRRLLTCTLLTVSCLLVPFSGAWGQSRTSPVDVDSLRRLLHAPEAGTRSNAAFELGQLGPRAAPAVAELLRMAQLDVDLRSRWMALRAIGWIGSGACQATGEVIALASDRSDEVRADAVHAIGSLGRECSSKRRTAQILDTLHARLKDSVSYVRRGALEQLGQFHARATHLVSTGLRSADDTLAARAAQLLGQGPQSNVARRALRAALGDTRDYVRHEVADALGGFGEGVRSVLERAQGSDSTSVREGAIRALAFLDYATAASIAGRCFRLEMAPWKEALAIGEDTIFSTPPRFVLFSTVKRAAWAPDQPVWLRVEPGPGEAYSIHGPGGWVARGDSVEVMWTTGFSGLTMRLLMSGDSLRGVASTFWDFPRPEQAASVRGVSASCKPR